MHSSYKRQTWEPHLGPINRRWARSIGPYISPVSCTLTEYCQSPPASSRRLASGLHRNESRTWKGALLWLHGPRHQGTLTRYPSWPSRAGPEAFSRSHFSRQSDRHAGCICIFGSGTQRATPCAGDYHQPCAHRQGMPLTCNPHPP